MGARVSRPRKGSEMDFAAVVSVLVVGAISIFVVLNIAKSTGKYSPEGEASIGVLGGLGLFVVLIAAIFLSSCGTAFPKVNSSSPRTVSVTAFKGLGEAQKLADSECAKYGRLARWVSGDVTYIFDCVL